MLRCSVLVAAIALTGCDKAPEVDVAGLERKVEVLESQARESADQRKAMGERLADAEDARALLAADLKNAKDTIGKLEVQVAELEAAPAPAELPKTPKPSTAGRAVKGERYNVVLGDATTTGNDAARVTIVMWSDFQCPFCNRTQATLKQIEREYGKDVRFAMKHNPLAFHKDAMAAAMAAEAAGLQGKFWEMHDLLYENQKVLTEANFMKWARKLKLNTSRFKAALNDPKLKSKILDHQAQASKLGARGVPAFFINGRHLSGAQPFANFKAIIDEEVAAADKLIASGTPKTAVYNALVKTGKDKPD